ncbi:MAG: hypothetical protein AAF211_33425 [Myxococcota bacterium]
MPVRILAALMVLGGAGLLLLPVVLLGIVVLSVLQSAMPDSPMFSLSFGVPGMVLGLLLLLVLVGMVLVLLGGWLWRRAKQPPAPTSPGRPLSRDDLVRAIEEESEGHRCIRLIDGRQLEGWIVFEDDPDAFTFSHAPSPLYAQAHGTDRMAPDDETIRLDSVAAWLDEDGVWRPIDQPSDQNHAS